MAEDPPAWSASDAPLESRAAILRRYIETEEDRLRGTLAVYLHRAWAMSHTEAWDRAQDVLAEVVTIALTKACDFDPRRSPQAWLLGIGSRVILRQRDAVFTQRRHEAGPPPGTQDESFGDDVLFDRLVAFSSPDSALGVEQAEAVDALLAPLAPAAQYVVRLGIIAGLQGEALAQVLDCSPGAARVRLFRAMQQLRRAWTTAAEGGTEGSQA